MLPPIIIVQCKTGVSPIVAIYSIPFKHSYFPLLYDYGRKSSSYFPTEKKPGGPSFELTRALHIYVDPRGWFSFQLNIPYLERVTQYQDQGCSQERLEKWHIQSITSCRWSSWKIWTNPRNRTYSVITSWWFQPLWKILVKMGIFPK